jgi:hypothetical protein
MSYQDCNVYGPKMYLNSCFLGEMSKKCEGLVTKIHFFDSVGVDRF